MISAILCTAVLASPPMPSIVTRTEWKASPRLAGAKPHVIRYVTIHHTGVKSNPARSLEEKLRGLQLFSQREDKLASGQTKPAWPDVPYHYYISIDGRIGEGREWFFTGDTNTEYDPTGHLLIVVEGEFGVEKPTDAQMKSLKDLTIWSCWKWRVPSDRIATHKDYSQQTACPGAALYEKMPQLVQDVRAALGR
jgi:hypothetical protein